MIESVIHGRDPQVLTTLLDYYRHPDGIIYDVTANERRMWEKVLVKNIVFSDIDAEVRPDIQCEFTALPYKSDTGSVIVFDPPHLPKAAGSEESLKPFVRKYGLNKTTDTDSISPIFAPFLIEARRVLKQEGLIFVKLSDYVHNHKYQWILVEFINAVWGVKGLTPTDLIIKCDPAAGNLKSGKWKTAHHARKSHCWWIIVRKGKCESALPAPVTVQAEDGEENKGLFRWDERV
jgi:hypothetical protein